jgi:hypothetical protein
MRRLPLVALALVTGACGTPDGTATAVPSSSASAAPTPAPTADDPAALEHLAWWRTDELGFGIIPEAPPDPDPPTQPGGYRQLTIGTLDGRITAVLALHPDWSHSYVGGPYGTDVLVANDTGTSSEVFMISALNGSRTDLFTTDQVVAAVAIGDDGAALYAIETNRETGVDSGLTRRPIGGGEVETLIAGPLATGASDVPVYWLTAEPLDAVVVAQWCNGQVSCDSTAIHVDNGQQLTDATVGWPLGADGELFFADGLGSNDVVRVWNLRTGSIEGVPGAGRSVPVRRAGGWAFVRDGLEDPGPEVLITPDGEARPIPGNVPEHSSVGTRGHDRGTVLPDGWVMRFSVARYFTIPELGLRGHGQLINTADGQRIDLAPPELAIADGAGCEIIPPRRMADGSAVGTGVLELVDGRRTVRWGYDAWAVHLSVGWRPPPADVLAIEAEIRGQFGSATHLVVDGEPLPAVTWVEAGCDYAVWLPADVPLDAVVEYAAAY